MLGLMYYKGDQVERDFSEAAKWYRLAAEQNDDLAAVRLGLMYTHGEGVAKDLVQAYKWIHIGDCVDKHFVMNWSRVWFEPFMSGNDISEALRLITEFRSRLTLRGND